MRIIDTYFDNTMPILDSKQTKQRLSEKIQDFFPNDREILMKLCLSEFGEPNGFHHPLAVAELAEVNNIVSHVIDDIQIGYVFITSFYYVQDAVVDRHERESGDKLYLPHLFTLAHRSYRNACRIASPQKVETFERLFFEYISKNSTAVRNELIHCSDPLSDAEDDRSIVERANSFLFLYPFLTTIFERPFDRQVYQTLCDFAFYLQMADDLIDWRSDYRSQRWTPFLRSAFREKKRVLNENELEDAIVQNGYLKKKIDEAVNGLNGIDSFFREKKNSSGLRILAMTQKQIQHLNEMVSDVSTDETNVACIIDD